jgi:hypothetical protein
MRQQGRRQRGGRRQADDRRSDQDPAARKTITGHATGQRQKQGHRALAG